MISSEELRYFLAVARRGTLVQAANELGVDQTTIGRHIKALEKSLGQRLFDRTSRGWELTTTGNSLLGPAQTAVGAVLAAEEALGGEGAPLQGRVRLVSVEGFGVWCLAPVLGELRQRHPGLTVELLTNTAHLPLSVRDFDVAVTMEEPVDNARLLKRHLASYVMRLYATQEYLDGAGPLDTVDQLANHTVMWWVDSLIDLQTLGKVRDQLGSIQVQGNTVGMLVQAARGSVGVAPIPQFIAQREPTLVHVLPEVEFWGNYWLLVPRELARLPRTRAVVELIDGVVDARHEEIGSLDPA